MADYQLRPDELRILEAACRTADNIVQLDAELKDADVLVEGSKGQDVVNPLFGEVRLQRLAFGRLLSHLGLDDADGVAGGQARSAAGRRLAAQRWQRKHQAAAV
jgi:hypothetical protein